LSHAQFAGPINDIEGGDSSKVTQNPKVSVIMPCFNHGEFLSEAVVSVFGLGRGDIELIVVDDGSTDERTRKEMDSLRVQGINVLRQENKGLAGARNAGIRISTGEYILPLDADDRLRPGWIDSAIEILDSKPTVGVVYGNAQRFGNRTDLWYVGPFDRDRLMRGNYIHCSALYRKSIWEQTGGYDGTMPVPGAEDWDLWLGALERDWQFVYLPEVFFDYRQAEGSMLNRLYASGLTQQLEEFVARKHGMLYRRAWVSLLDERRSARRTIRQLATLLLSRAKGKLGR
jgi:glycosyltransferase involved in cell wall biosynthesis